MQAQIIQQKRERTSMIFFRVSFTVILFAAVALLYLMYLIFFPIKVIEITGDIAVTPNPVVAGEQFSTLIHYCKYIDSRSIITRHIEKVGGEPVVIPLAIVSSQAPLGCGFFNIHTAVPEYLEPGRYKLVTTFQVQANAVQAQYITVSSEEFDVVNTKTDF